VRRISEQRRLRRCALDGAYLVDAEPPVFRRIAAPSAKELEALVARIAERIGRALEHKGLLVRDCENSYLSFDAAAGGPMDDLLGHSITYRVAMGPRAGQKMFTLQTVPAQSEEEPRKGVAQKRVFGIEIEQCARCGGRLKAIASIEEPELIERILAHRRERGGEEAMTVSLGARAPPQASLL
jgi:hypothetical protein